jgi:hypothetical protein
MGEESQAIRVLRAEWSHLNSPERIQALSQKHLTLRNIEPDQVVQMKDIPFRPVDDGDDLDAVGGPELSIESLIDRDNEVNTRGGNADG